VDAVVYCAIGVIVVMVPPARWQRVAVTALLVIPLVLVIGLCAPMWLALPFLPEQRRHTVLQFLRYLIDWVEAIARVVQQETPATDPPASDPQRRVRR
jgi:hypothetical protein